jgi:hypothetical protein
MSRHSRRERSQHEHFVGRRFSSCHVASEAYVPITPPQQSSLIPVLRSSDEPSNTRAEAMSSLSKTGVVHQKECQPCMLS